jgi:predicted restriction endonuclease
MARERDEYTCRKCGKKFEGKELHAHHLIPHASGGTHDLDNLVSLCNVDHRFVEHKFWAVLKAELGTARFTALLEKARVEVLSKLRSV